MCVLCCTREKGRRREEYVEVLEMVKVGAAARKFLRVWGRRAQGRVRRAFFGARERRKGEVKKKK